MIKSTKNPNDSNRQSNPLSASTHSGTDYSLCVLRQGIRAEICVLQDVFGALNTAFWLLTLQRNTEAGVYWDVILLPVQCEI